MSVWSAVEDLRKKFSFRVPGGLLPDGTTVSLSVASSVVPGAVVRYSIGQAVPTELSPVVTGPIAITATTTVRARVFAPGVAARAGEQPDVFAARSQPDEIQRFE